MRLIERGHRVLSLDVKKPTAQVAEQTSCDLSDTASIDVALSRIAVPVSALLNIAGVPGTVGGLLTALEILAVVRATGRPLADLARDMPVYPQIHRNVRVQRLTGPPKPPAAPAAAASSAQATR